MKLFITFWLPNQTPMAGAPPSTVKAVSGKCTTRRASSVMPTSSA